VTNMHKQSFTDQDKINDLFSICSSSQAGALGLLLQSEARGVDAAPFLEAFAIELRELDRHAVQKLAAQCRAGFPLVDVMEAGAHFFPAPVILAVRLAHDSDTLAEFCESVSARPIYQPKMRDLSKLSPLRRITTVLTRTLTFVSVVSFVMLFIIPQFQAMFEEFGMELPPVTKLLIQTANVFCLFWFIPFGLLLFLGIWHLSRSHKKILRVFSPSRWNQIEHSPAVQTKLNLAWLSDSGIGVAKGLEQLARFEHGKRANDKLKKAAVRSEGGQNPWKALGIEGILSSKESLALETAQSTETRSWLLRQMAMAQSTRHQTWSATRGWLLTTLANVVLGLFVLLFCVGMFAPLIQLIRSLG